MQGGLTADDAAESFGRHARILGELAMNGAGGIATQLFKLLYANITLVLQHGLDHRSGEISGFVQRGGCKVAVEHLHLLT
ncbi:hypothetical protein D3C75_1135320 [compost metagenome]